MPREHGVAARHPAASRSRHRANLVPVDPSAHSENTEHAIFRRLPFELSGDEPRRHLRDPDGITWRSADDDEELAQLLARVLRVSTDPRDVDSVRRRSGARAVAGAMVEEAQGGHGYEADRRWWSIVERGGAASGFVLPVVFSGCTRGGLDEGTIYHVGVVPEQRGHALAHHLLARGTDALLDHGVWRIAVDTAIENAPMIRILERQGWTRLAPVDAGSHPLPGLPDRRHS